MPATGLKKRSAVVMFLLTLQHVINRNVLANAEVPA